VASAWSATTGEVVRVDRFWEPPPLDRAVVRLYGSDSFASAAFAGAPAATVRVPRTVVLDVGLHDQSWRLIEANATGGSGLNGCEPAGVVECLKAATVDR